MGINLLREGLDLPEVSLVVVLDADREGFLRSDTSLIQTFGRASRNVKGRVILYAKELTGSIKRAVRESGRRRDFQINYNKVHRIVPSSINKTIKDFYDDDYWVRKSVEEIPATFDTRENLMEEINKTTAAMRNKADQLEFKEAALLRDRLNGLKSLLVEMF